MQQSLQFLQALAMELDRWCSRRSRSTRFWRNRRTGQAGDRCGRLGQTSQDLRQKDEEWSASIFPKQHARLRSYNPEAAERRQFLFDSQVEAPHLSDHLLRQLTLATSNPEMLRVGEEINGNIDDAGFLKVP